MARHPPSPGRRVHESSKQATERKHKAKVRRSGAHKALDKAYRKLGASDDVKGALATLVEDLAELGIKLFAPKKKRGK